MKKLFGAFSILSLFGILLLSCESNTPSRSLRSSSSKIEFLSPKPGSRHIWGDTILFDLRLKKEGEVAAKSIDLYIDGLLVNSVDGSDMNFAYPSNMGSGGQVKVKGVVNFEDGSNSRRRMGLKIFSDTEPEQLSYQLINTFPHDPSAFTQGLHYDIKEDLLFEGTGNYTESRLIKTRVGNSEHELDVAIPDEYFGEGITLLNDTVYQLTYKKKKGFYYDRSFTKLGEFSYPSEGWGLCNDGENLIMSDGSATLVFLDPQSFQTVKSIQVFSEKGPLYNLNELEYVEGVIYANIYTSDYIAKIDANSGKVLALINMEGLLSKNDVDGRIDVLNGIAFNPSFQSFYVTGKWWPKLFEVRFTKSE